MSPGYRSGLRVYRPEIGVMINDKVPTRNQIRLKSLEVDTSVGRCSEIEVRRKTTVECCQVVQISLGYNSGEIGSAGGSPEGPVSEQAA